MKILALSLMMALGALPAVHGGRRCTKPQGNEGESYTNVCLKMTCKARVWRSSLDDSICCYNSHPYLPNTTITAIKEGCATAIILATAVLQVENNCGDHFTKEQIQEIKHILIKYMEQTDCNKDSPLSTSTLSTITEWRPTRPPWVEGATHDHSMQPVCHCVEGYDGDSCNICSDNCYPGGAGGKCTPCDCCNNWDKTEEGNCDTHTGECLKCLFYTEGFNCERCVEGFYGDAVTSQCMECQCDPLGTDPDRYACDRETGQCFCAPNVEGEYCSKCREGYWNIASGEGCESCACDPVGSTGYQCHDQSGQCDCIQGFGGRQCDIFL